MPWPIENRIVTYFIAAAKQSGREYIDLKPDAVAEALGVSLRTASDSMRDMAASGMLAVLYVSRFNSHHTKPVKSRIYRLACATPRPRFVPLKKAFVGPVVGIR